MLVIRDQQMEAFEKPILERFKVELSVILLFEHPQFRQMDSAAWSSVLDRSIRAARQFGFKTKREVLYFCMLACEFGEQFHNSPKYPGVRSQLSQPDQSPQERLDAAQAYLNRIAFAYRENS